MLYKWALFFVLCFSSLITKGIGPHQFADSLRKNQPELTQVDLAEYLRKECIGLKNANQFEASINFGEYALKIFKEEGSVEGQSKTLNNLGTAYNRSGNVVKAIEAYNNSINLAEASGNIPIAIKSRYNLSNTLYANGYLKQAEENLLKALADGKSIDDPGILGSIHNLLGSLYSDEKYAKYNIALEHLDSAKTYYEQSNRRSRIPVVLFNTGYINERMGNYQQALSAYKLYLSEFDKEVSSNSKITALINIGNIYRVRYEQPEVALEYYKQGLTIAKKIDARDKELDILSNMVEVELETGSPTGIITRYERLKHLRDSIYDIEREQQVAEIQTEFDTERKESELKIQKALNEQQNSRNLVLTLILICVLLLGGIVILFLRNRIRLVNLLKEKEEQIHQGEIEGLQQKHKVESLGVLLKSQENERKRIASDLHDKLGGKLAAIKLLLRSGNKDRADIASVIGEVIGDLRNISHDLHSGILARFGLIEAINDHLSNLKESGEYKVNFEYDEFEHRMEPILERTLFAVIQELVNNTMKHAEASEITLQLIKYPDDTLNLIYEDNGKGFDASSHQNGLGLESIRHRMEKIGAEFSIDSSPGLGSTFIIKVDHLQRFQIV